MLVTDEERAEVRALYAKVMCAVAVKSFVASYTGQDHVLAARLGAMWVEQDIVEWTAFQRVLELSTRYHDRAALLRWADDGGAA